MPIASLACFVGFPAEAGFVRRVGRVWVPGSYGDDVQLEVGLLARSTAVLRARFASSELSVVKRILVGKMLICASVVELLFEHY